ncbi:MAG: gamma-glutamyl-gamma-aminobutyrate hydrolase family protein [Nitrospiraceae bacterium]|nr:gamma-glutamyl-gamma-aminobutyrate hydrolase family protein [Nitrospiraceae bacterium]
MKPLIGVTPDFNAGDRKEWGGREATFFLRARYILAIEDLGGVPVILPLTEDHADRRRLLNDLDGLLLTGSGPDLPPSLYGERRRYKFRVMSRRRADFELDVARMAAASRLPVLGICGGMQAINVAFGGSLLQDIASQADSPLPHQQKVSATELSHTVDVAPHSLLRRILGQARIRVNSSHHQSVKRVAPSLVASAVASDGIIEAIESPKHRFLLGVQWHPEFLYDRYAFHRKLFQALVKAARA